MISSELLNRMDRGTDRLNISDAQVEYGSYSMIRRRKSANNIFIVSLQKFSGLFGSVYTVRSSVVEYLAIVDELCDWSQVYSIDGQWN